VGDDRGVRRIPLKEAAVALGISKDAVRQRIRRGTLRSDKGEDGRVYVYLDPTAYEYLDPSAGAARPSDGGVVD
jgi:DNA-binding Lrp family transcriptional regulator